MTFLLATVLAVIPAQVTSTPSASTSLAFLASYVGKTPSDAKVFQNSVVKQRLAALLKADASLVPQRFQTENPIQAKGDFIALFGNKAHSGGSDDALIVVHTRQTNSGFGCESKERCGGSAPEPIRSGFPTTRECCRRT